MDANIILGPGAIAGGSTLLDSFIATLYYADSISSFDSSSQTAVAQTQPEDDDGYDGKVTFHGIVNDSDTTITDFKLELDGVEELTATGLSIDFQDMKTAIESAGPDDSGGFIIQPLVDVLHGINWTLDASTSTKAILAYGTGGDDHFTMTKFNDLLERDGGDDIVDMGEGDDSVFFGNNFGFIADHQGHASIDGGKGSDTLAFFLAGNYFLGDYASIATDKGFNFDLQNGTANQKGSDDFNFNRYYSFENVNGTEMGDTILGSKIANRLDGSSGDDAINARAGNDVVIGGLGKDNLIGGDGADDFVFQQAKDSSTGAKRDVIRDFVHKLDDIDLSFIGDISDGKVRFVDEQALKHVGDVHFVLHDEKGSKHDFTLVEANIAGNAKPELQIELSGLVHLDAKDFLF